MGDSWEKAKRNPLKHDAGQSAANRLRRMQFFKNYV
jgi:hypothetical protein